MTMRHRGVAGQPRYRNLPRCSWSVGVSRRWAALPGDGADGAADPSWNGKTVAGRYSMVRSAWSRSEGEIVRPIDFAVFRFRTSSNFVGRSIGSSPGLAPRRTRSTYTAARRRMFGKLGPYDSKPPSA